jgi:hypothetical protein
MVLCIISFMTCIKDNGKSIAIILLFTILNVRKINYLLGHNIILSNFFLRFYNENCKFFCRHDIRNFIYTIYD